MSRNQSTVLLEPRSIKESYSTSKSQYTAKKSPRISGDELARQITDYLERTDISPREYRVPGAE